MKVNGYWEGEVWLVSFSSFPLLIDAVTTITETKTSFSIDGKKVAAFSD